MKYIINLIVIAIIFASCGSGSGDSDGFPTQGVVTNTTNSATATFGSSDKSFLSYLFENEYLWYDKIDTNIDTTTFDKPMDMIESLRYRIYDRWSYAETFQEYEDFANQKSTGSFGFYYDEDFKVLNIILDSPADKAGLLRGDIMTHINDTDISNEVLIKAKSNLDIVSKFRVIRDNRVLELNIAPSIYTFKVTKYQILNMNSKKIGLLRYDQFTSSSITEIDKAFTYFKANNIDELIIDLRYNGGGSLATTSVLLDKIAGLSNDKSLQFYLNFNDKLISKDESYYFEKDSNSLDMKRVFFLTTSNSASASEVTINSLKPYIDVKLIGSTTHGKPVGMSGRSYGNYIYWLINFTILNAVDDGEFYDGISVDCEANDDFDYPRDNINEDMLEEALYYIEYNSCKSSSSYNRRAKYEIYINKI